MDFIHQEKWKWAIRSLIACSLLGLCLGHWCADTPYRSILWDEELMTPFLNFFGSSWDAWANNLDVNDGIDQFSWFIGLWFFILALCSFIPWPERKAWLYAAVCFLSISFIALFRWANHAYDLIWPLEFFLRLSIPLLIWTLCQSALEQKTKDKLLSILLICCSCTFIGHGCYALGLHPTPLAFRQMISAIGISSETAIDYSLVAIGAIDILVAGLVWWSATKRVAVLWMCIWGSFTALMRLSFIDWGFFGETALPALAAFLERLPHLFIPFIIWKSLALNTQESETTHEPL